MSWGNSAKGGGGNVSAPSARERVFDIDNRGTYSVIERTHHVKARSISVGDRIDTRGAKALGANKVAEGWNSKHTGGKVTGYPTIVVTGVKKTAKAVTITGEYTITPRTGKKSTRTATKTFKLTDTIICEKR